MKKFKFAAGLLGLAMLGACSSDAPELVDNGGNSGETAQMYLSLNFKGQDTTRATTDAGESYEKEIKTLQVLIYDASGNLYVNEYIDSSDADSDNSISGTTCIFGVDSYKFNTMLNNRTKNWKIILYANSAEITTAATINTAAGFEGSSGTAVTWGVANFSGDPANTKGFIMSNASESQTTLEDPATGHDGTTTLKAWKIRGNVEISRLCARFDWDETNSMMATNAYKPEVDNNLTMTILGMDVNTFASKTYRIAHYSKDGSNSHTDGMTNYIKDAAAGKIYRVTETITGVSDDDSDRFPTYAGHHYSLTADKSLYDRPNTITTAEATALTNASANPSKDWFYKIPYAAVKVKFEHKNFTASAAKQERTFAINGVFVGGMRDIKAMKGKTLDEVKALFDCKLTDTDDAKELTAFNDFVETLHNWVTSYTFKDYDDAENGSSNRTADMNAFKNAFNNKVVEYTYNTDDQCYRCFYAALIYNNKDNESLLDRYGISRNTIYKLGVNSFKFMGLNSGYHPGDDTPESNVTTLNMELSVKILDWQVVSENNWDFK